MSDESLQLCVSASNIAYLQRSEQTTCVSASSFTIRGSVVQDIGELHEDSQVETLLMVRQTGVSLVFWGIIAGMIYKTCSDLYPRVPRMKHRVLSSHETFPHACSASSQTTEQYTTHLRVSGHVFSTLGARSQEKRCCCCSYCCRPLRHFPLPTRRRTRQLLQAQKLCGLQPQQC